MVKSRFILDIGSEISYIYSELLLTNHFVMKRIVFLLGLLALCCTPGFAQDQLENPGFEEWEDIAASPTDTIREPVQWSSLKTSDDPALTPLAPVVCTRSNMAHTGNHSVKLTNVEVFGIAANGIVTNGRIHPNITPALAYTYTDTVNEQWHTKFTSRPDSITGWYMYAPQGNDSLQVKLTLHQGYGQQPDDDEEANWIGVAEFKSGTNTEGVWERFSVPFTYFSEEIPEYVLVVISSGNAYNAIANSAAYFDDLEMIYNSTHAGVTPEKPAGFIAVAGLRKLWIKDMDMADFDRIRVFNITGKMVWNSRLDSEWIDLSRAQLPQGIYVVNLSGSRNVFTQKVILR